MTRSDAQPRADIAILGGGLAGGLIALALRRADPSLSVVLVEAGDMLGGNHRWSWFESDLSPQGTALLGPFRKIQWPAGYDVHFPEHSRRLDSTYCSLSSADFDAALRRELAQSTIHTGRTVAAVDARGATLEGGDRIEARCVIDARGFILSDAFQGGWQVFMGRHLRTEAPHGVDRPIVMDAKVRQHDAFRFVYTLPLAADQLFVEDTYYQDTPVLDRAALSRRIDRYCARLGWEGEPIGFETGVLPVVTGGDLARYQREMRVPGVAMAGARGMIAHPLTSYTLPFAVETALLVAENRDLTGEQMAALLEAHARRVWQRTGFYRMLGTMLFGAAKPDERYRIFSRFYRLSPGLIERFYAARSTGADKLRTLTGKPPVPISRALRALAGHRPPLTSQEGSQTDG
ncbi:MAG: lycopene beta-cyclase CrtY [Erythrobacter sp.]|nr:lycopene beta-cyclase CrtY [Erythrobacter sp.]NCQ63941.1 lycopene beta-cyclase CrtY [Alphaproteobacteria bacterium]